MPQRAGKPKASRLGRAAGYNGASSIRMPSKTARSAARAGRGDACPPSAELGGCLVQPQRGTPIQAGPLGRPYCVGPAGCSVCTGRPGAGWLRVNSSKQGAGNRPKCSIQLVPYAEPHTHPASLIVVMPNHTLHAQRSPCPALTPRPQPSQPAGAARLSLTSNPWRSVCRGQGKLGGGAGSSTLESDSGSVAPARQQRYVA